MVAEQGVKEQLKTENLLAWMGPSLDNNRSAAEEVILDELIYS